MNINKRLFGTPIRGKVREKLEDRQRLAEAPQAGESIESIPGVFTENGKIVNELGSRTPFVRMWTSVKLVEPELIEEVLQEFEYVPGVPVYQDNKVLESEAADEVNKQKIDTSVEEFLGTLNYTPIVEKRFDENTGAFKVYIKKPIKGNNGEILSPRDQIDYASTVYIVGDHNYQKKYGEVSTNDSLSYYAEDSIDSDLFDSSERQIGDRTIGEIAEDLFPQELKTNKFLKPQAGILGVTSQTEGSLGVIKKTTVNFVVHNFTDYDKIYNKYFLKPGATIFVDFGWSSVSELYNPLELIENGRLESYLYDEQTGFVAKNNGDVEVIRGIVTDYSSKILPNGSVECEVTLTSSNSALLGFSVNDSKVRTIQNILNYGILYLAVEPTLNQGFQSDDSTRDSDLFKNTPNAYWSTDEIFNFNENLKALAQRQIGSDDLIPDGNAIRTGVYINSYEVDDVYISLGLLEDLIINSQFGFGKGVTDINNGGNLQIRFNSSNSFTTFKKFFIDKQRILDASPEEPPVFLYPKTWGNTDGGIVAAPGSEAGDISSGGQYNEKNWVSTPVGKGSYSFQVGKYPFEQYLNFAQNPRGEQELGVESFYREDESKNRIPVRELFVHVGEVIESFESQPNVRKVISDILDKINEESDGMLNLKVSQGETDGEMAIIDLNHSKTQNDINNAGSDTIENEAFKDLFTFSVMSPNSIVKNYNLSFKIPSGNIGNMYAIQGMGHSSKSFPITKDLDDAIAMNAVDNDNLSIIYEPDLGSFRSTQLSGDNTQDASLINVYQNAKKLLSNKTYTPSAMRTSENILPGTLETESWKDDDIKIRSENYDNLNNESKEKLKQEKLLEANISKQQALGLRVVGDFREYYKLREIKEIVMKTRSNLLPYSLNLTTYGIGSIVPGDTFRVDYLPKMHLDNTYAQTIKVAHNINSDGWYTTLDTQFRIRPSVKVGSYVNLDLSDARLSPKAIDQLKLMPWHPENPATVSRYELGEQTQMAVKDSKGQLPGDRVGYQSATKTNGLKQKSVKQLHPYMSGIKILEPPEDGYEFLSMVLTFTWTGEEQQLFFPQANFASHMSEQYLDYRVVDKLDWLLNKEEASGFTTLIEYLTDSGEEGSSEGNVNMNADDYSKWVNFPTAFEFGGYVSREDFYNPELDFMFDIGPESESRTSYAVRQSGNESIQVLSDIFNESVFERLMGAYGLGRMNEDGTINEKLMYTGPHQVTLKKNKSYYWYINGRYWAMAESGLNPEYQNDSELVDSFANWTDYDKLVDPVMLSDTQCKSYYWNNIIGGLYQIESENKRVNNVLTEIIYGDQDLFNPILSNFSCPDPVPNGEQTPNYANLDDCNANCEAECVQI